ncbi:AlpA family phage regulatory protein [Pseudoxanthomonas sp. LjRoot143]|uniref:helix-turn-helix transcriptional regulator n=1 Tax=Pseudoxanthomonas sp. LjRoot143 TaxID=3342266 RepID=UPI003ECEAB92
MTTELQRPAGSAPSDRLLDFDQLSDKVGMKRTAIYAAISAGTFPAPVKIGKLSRWVETEVDAWIDGLKRQRAA